MLSYAAGVTQRAIVRAPRGRGRMAHRRYALIHHHNTQHLPAEDVTIYVKGFLGKGESAADFHEWFNAHKLIVESGRKVWSTKVAGFRWQNGEMPRPVPLVSGSLLAFRLLKLKSSLVRLTPLGLAASFSVDIAMYTAMLAAEYYNADSSLAEQSLLFAEQLLHMHSTHSRVRVVAHSLGCRLLYHAIQHLPHDKRPHEIHMLAPAFTESEVGFGLDELARDSITVYHNKDDYILSLLYTGISGGSQAVGCVGLERTYVKAKAVDTKAHFAWFVHSEYVREFPKFLL